MNEHQMTEQVSARERERRSRESDLAEARSRLAEFAPRDRHGKAWKRAVNAHRRAAEAVAQMMEVSA